MSDSEVVIKVENLWKQYCYGAISHATLMKDIQSRWARFRGKPDPNSRIDLHQEPGTRNRQPDSFWALRDISFEVKQGEILGIIGKNGAGKSTLLKIMSRVTTPTKGQVKINGRIASLLEIGTGFHPELTGRENIFLNGAILGMSKSEIRRKFDEIVTFAAIEKFINTPVKRYSSGMYVRLAFAVAAHLEPEILVVDEVLAVGDIEFQKKCLGKMEDVASEGRTVLFVSHNMSTIRRICSKTLLFESGRLVDSGDSATIIDAYLTNLTTARCEKQVLPAEYIYYNPEVTYENGCAVTAIQMLDENEQPKQKLYSWDFVRFRIHFEANKFIQRGSVVFKVMTREEVTMLLCSTMPDSTVPCIIEAGSQYADCVFLKWPFSAGTYVVGAGLAFPGVHYIWMRDNLCALEVEEKDVFDSGLPPTSNRYLVATDHFWETSQSRNTRSYNGITNG